jgi:hypothetical protein
MVSSLMRGRNRLEAGVQIARLVGENAGDAVTDD